MAERQSAQMSEIKNVRLGLLCQSVVISNQIKFIKQQRAKSHLQVAKTMIKILIYATYNTC